MDHDTVAYMWARVWACAASSHNQIVLQSRSIDQKVEKMLR